MTQNTPKTAEQAPLAFDWRDMTKARVRPAAFAKMVGVSRQTVSCWIRDGKVTLHPDGKLDPAVAARQVLERSDPSRLRARVFRQATEDADSLRRRIAALENELQGARGRIDFLKGFSKAQDFALQACKAILVARHASIQGLALAAWSALLDEIVERCEYIADGFDPDDADDAGGHDPRQLLDRELGLDVLPDPRASGETEGARANE